MSKNARNMIDLIMFTVGSLVIGLAAHSVPVGCIIWGMSVIAWIGKDK